jgi:hypothetical protein
VRFNLILVGLPETETDATVKQTIAHGTESWRGLRSSIGSNVRAKIPLACLTIIDSSPVMLYANTLITVATICHVRRRPVWFHPVTELPTLGAPALTFDSGLDMASDSPHMRQTNDSETPMLGTARSNVNPPRAPSHFRSRVTSFPQHSTHRTGTLSALPSPLPTSESVESLAPSISSTQADVTSSQNPVSHSQPRTYPRIVPLEEPPTYSDPGAGYQSESL